VRERYPITLSAGGRWPGAQGGVNLPPFNWVLIDNRGSNAVDVALSANPAAGDKIDTLFTVGAGKVRVKNLAGPNPPRSDTPDAGEAWPRQLHLVSASGTTVVIEIADHPIVDQVYGT